ncbi:MAG: DUF1080 domain-containing protein [Bryobacterales bacterium]|nr:DUF1080 domain-containing protein [Bryobacterales bacterium]
MRFVPFGLLLAATALLAQTDMPPARWHNVRTLSVEGQGWSQTKHPFDRLPAKAHGVVRDPVWNLSEDSTGFSARFVTNAEWIRARWTVRKSRLALPHMPSTGVSGLDLYARSGGAWHWAGAGRPGSAKENDAFLARGLDGELREYQIYLPLYNGIESLEIGVPEGATFERAPPRPSGQKPVVFYGTSILQGGCASRPGMAYPSIIGRRLDWPTINLGFSGNGKTEPEMAALLAELDPAVYVLDSLPNLSPEETAERMEPFVRKLRKARARTPIVLVENVMYTDGLFVESRRQRYTESNKILERLYAKLKAAGDANLYYVPAGGLLGDDGEGTVDGAHPTDLGFLRMAEVIGQTVAPLVRPGMTFPVEPGFRSLFDGQSLNGWKRLDTVPDMHVGGKWTVVNGVLTGVQDPPGRGGFLVTGETFSDFVLRFQVQLDYPVDSGVFLRMGEDGKSHQVTLDYRPKGDLGGIYLPWTQNMVLRNPTGIEAFKPQTWNDVEVRIEGEPARIRCWINGRMVTDFQHTEATTKGVPRRGRIALQVHPDVAHLTIWKEGNQVRFRNIRIKPLD